MLVCKLRVQRMLRVDPEEDMPAFRSYW